MISLSRGNTRFLLSSFAVILVLTIGAGIIPQIDAENFGILLDNTCKTMLKNNISSNCPTYEDIITLFPDTSNQDVSGKFAYYNGIYQRSPAKLVNSLEYYRFGDGTIIFIDPLADYQTRIKTIEIKANLDQYLFRGKIKSYNPVDHTLTLGVSRYIDSCRNAYVSADNWIDLVGDTLYHMQQKCTPESTRFNSTVTTQLNKTVHDITSTYKWQLAQWQKAAIDRCGQKICLYEKDNPAP